MAKQTSSKSRNYISGKPLSDDLRQLVIDDLHANGAIVNEVTFPGLPALAAKTADKYRIHRKTVIRMWTQFCLEGNLKPKQPGRMAGEKLKLSDQALGLIQFYLLDNPSITVKEIKRNLVNDGGLSAENEVCDVTIQNALKHHLPTSQTHKKMIVNHARRFSPDNLAYTQAFIDELHERDPNSLKFFDEAGFCPKSNHPTYGWSEKGVRCVDVLKYAESPHYTLNLMIGTNGIAYANVVEGATDGIEFVEFFGQATQRHNEIGEPFLKYGDVVIVDNCPTHHGQYEQIVKEYLTPLGIELLYTPRYSPEMNPAEYAFNKIKTLLKQTRFRELYRLNASYTIYELLKEITVTDCRGFFKATKYLDI